MTVFGTKLRETRTNENLSIRDLAAATGLSSSAISRYENFGRSPSLASTIRLAKALNISVEQIADWMREDMKA